MNKLFELGLDEDTVKFMIEQCNNIINMSDEDINEKIKILRYIGCSERQIRNIVGSNPYYLNRITSDVIKLVNYLKQIGYNDINLLFESNPYFINYDVFEIENYIGNELDNGIELDIIIDNIRDNPYIIDEG